jgi:hypothetical protein
VTVFHLTEPQKEIFSSMPLAVKAVMSQDVEGVPDPRLAEIAGALRNRLRPVCSHMDNEDFEALIDEIARRERRWERRSSLKVYRSDERRAN